MTMPQEGTVFDPDDDPAGPQVGTIIDPGEMRAPKIKDLKCCLLEATKNKLILADLKVPELVYPSACGSPPVCLDRSYMTAFIAEPGVTAPQETNCGFIREATFVVCYGICTGVSIGKPKCEGHHPGACGEEPPPGSYAAESMMIDDALDAMVCAHECFECTSGRCDKIHLAGSAIDCDNQRPTVSVSWRVRW